MTTPAEQRAAIDTAIAISERFLFGDLARVVMGEIKAQQIPWGALPENEQQKVINRVQERLMEATVQVVRLVAGKARPTVQATVESVTFKDGVKTTLVFSKHQADRHAIADAAGQDVLLVLPVFESVLGGDMPAADKDQQALL